MLIFSVNSFNSRVGCISLLLILPTVLFLSLLPFLSLSCHFFFHSPSLFLTCLLSPFRVYFWPRVFLQTLQLKMSLWEYLLVSFKILNVRLLPSFLSPDSIVAQFNFKLPMTLVCARTVPTIKNINNSTGKGGHWESTEFLPEDGYEWVWFATLVGKGGRRKINNLKTKQKV